MSNLTYSIDIAAPRQTVWRVMLNPDSYREWATAFQDNPYYEGSWDEGSLVRFLAQHSGKISGLLARVTKNIPNKQIMLEYLGEVVNGTDDTTSTTAQQWHGAIESYTFEGVDDNTTKLTIEMEGANISPMMMELFAGMWPHALEIVSRLAEAEA